MKKLALILLSLYCIATVNAQMQSDRLWTEADRKFLLDNLQRSKDEILKETTNLTEPQWNFKESPDRWSINQVVEHISIWELLLEREISVGLGAGPVSTLPANMQPDSVYLKFIMEEKAHIATDYTKPFTFTVPMGLNPGQNNVAWLMKLRDESIEYVKTTHDDLRRCLARPNRSVHQNYLIVFGHADRHLRQIMKIKSNANYPK